MVQKSEQADTWAAVVRAPLGRRALLISAAVWATLVAPGDAGAQDNGKNHAQENSAPENGEGSDEPVFDLGADITPPRVIHQVSPKPDSGEQGFRITGVVLIGLVVSSHGLPVNVHVVHSVDKDIDQSAIEAVRQWRFDPARKGDKPVAVRLTIEIRFHDV